MKKLLTISSMIAVFVFGGYSFADTYSETNTTNTCTFAYRVKVILRTTAAKASEATLPCEDKVCYRVKKYRRLIGFLYGTTDSEDVSTCGCSTVTKCACNTWKNTKLVLWDYDTHETYKVDTAELLVLDRIANDDSQSVEISFTIDGLVFGGFGTCGMHDGNVTLATATGFCAGVMPSPVCENCHGCGDIVPSAVWSICAALYSAPDAEATYTAAYGKWSMTFDQTAASKIFDGEIATPPGYELATSINVDFNAE